MWSYLPKVWRSSFPQSHLDPHCTWVGLAWRLCVHDSSQDERLSVERNEHWHPMGAERWSSAIAKWLYTTVAAFTVICDEGWALMVTEASCLLLYIGSLRLSWVFNAIAHVLAKCPGLPLQVDVWLDAHIFHSWASVLAGYDRHEMKHAVWGVFEQMLLVPQKHRHL